MLCANARLGPLAPRPAQDHTSGPPLSPEARYNHARRQRERRAQLALERRKHAEASIKFALDLAAELGVEKARAHVRARKMHLLSYFFKLWMESAATLRCSSCGNAPEAKC